VEELGLSDVIKFAGYRADIPSILKSLDICVQASLSENLGGTIEGLLMECPMVATRVGGLVDSVIDGQTGVLVELNGLAEGILRLLHDPVKAKELGSRGRHYMLENFTLRKTVEDQDALYRALLSRASKGYRFYVQVLRIIPGIAVCSVLALRYGLLDSRLLPAWDAGWRPWRFIAARRFVLRVIDYLLRKIGYVEKKLDIRAIGKPKLGSEIGINKSERFYTAKIPALPPIKSKLNILATMLLYRIYSFIGRQKLGWGLRKRAKDFIRTFLSIKNK